jgi:hypothetical protein
LEKRSKDTLRKLIVSASSTLFGDVDVCYKLNECLEDKRKFQITINGFSGNWTNINIRMQKGDVDWEHYTINRRKL